MREKEKRGNITILYHTCASEQHHVFHIESLLCCHFLILVGIFHYMHTHLVFILSFHTLIALSASVAWQSLLLTLISIDGHLRSSLVRRVDVRLSQLLSSLYLPLSSYSIPPVVLYPWLALMYCVRVEKAEAC